MAVFILLRVPGEFGEPFQSEDFYIYHRPYFLVGGKWQMVTRQLKDFRNCEKCCWRTCVGAIYLLPNVN